MSKIRENSRCLSFQYFFVLLLLTLFFLYALPLSYNCPYYRHFHLLSAALSFTIKIFPHPHCPIASSPAYLYLPYSFFLVLIFHPLDLLDFS